jgi:hypothetical protein
MMPLRPWVASWVTFSPSPMVLKPLLTMPVWFVGAEKGRHRYSVQPSTVHKLTKALFMPPQELLARDDGPESEA